MDTNPARPITRSEIFTFKRSLLFAAISRIAFILILSVACCRAEDDASGALPDERKFPGIRDFQTLLATYATGRPIAFSDRAAIAATVP